MEGNVVAAFEIYLFSLDSVTSYTGPGTLFPNSTLGNTGVGGTVTLGALDGEKIVVNDNDPDFEDGDTGILGIEGKLRPSRATCSTCRDPVKRNITIRLRTRTQAILSIYMPLRIRGFWG